MELGWTRVKCSRDNKNALMTTYIKHFFFYCCRFAERHWLLLFPDIGKKTLRISREIIGLAHILLSAYKSARVRRCWKSASGRGRYNFRWIYITGIYGRVRWFTMSRVNRDILPPIAEEIADRRFIVVLHWLCDAMRALSCAGSCAVSSFKCTIAFCWSEEKTRTLISHLFLN